MAGTVASVLDRMVERVEEASTLDALGQRLSELVASAVRPAAVTDALSGTWLGHPLHPVLVAVPIGSWIGAGVLDVGGGAGSAVAARRLIGLGLVAALPTAASGASDWTTTLGAERRVGMAHAAANWSAIACYGLSWLARARRTTGLAKGLAAAGAGLIAVGGYLGGHLSYAQGVGVDTTAFRTGPGEWTAVVPVADIAEQALSAAPVGEVSVLLARDGERVRALDNRCTHRGGPLADGERKDGCVACPWHASIFRLDDGSVVHGPASRPQPCYETRTIDGQLEVRRPEARALRTNPVGAGSD